MNEYFLNMNTQSNGDNELHKSSCAYYQKYKLYGNFDEIGFYYYDIDALRAANIKHPEFAKINGCANCCKSINTD